MALIEPRTLKGFRDYLPAQQIIQCWALTTIRDVDHVNARHEIEQLARHVRSAARSGRCHIDFPRIALRVGDQFRH